MTSIGYSISPNLWDAEKMRVRPGTKKAPTTNSKGITAAVINARISKISAAFAELDAMRPQPALDVYKLNLDRITEKNRALSDKSDLFQGLELFMAQRDKAEQWSDKTEDNWRTLRNHLKYYNPNLTYSYFTEQGLQDFLNYLRTTGASANHEQRSLQKLAELKARTGGTALQKYMTKRYIKSIQEDLKSLSPEGLQESSVKQLQLRLCSFLRWSLEKGLTAEDAVLKFRPKYKMTEGTVVFLTHEELLKLYHADLSETSGGLSYQEMIRDMFCFCAFTSLRYSDMQALRWNMIRNDIIYITTKKTYTALEIPLNDYSREILDRYREGSEASGHVFPSMTVKTMNKYLKEICKELGFDEMLTKVYYKGMQRIEDTRPKWEWIGTHAARRTFICYALSQGIPPQIVMKFTGHSDYQSMRPYIDIAAADKVKAMEVFNRK